MLGSVPKILTTFGVVVALSASPALATAAAPPAAINPMIALSIFGSQASAAALCGSAIATTAGAAVTTQAPAGGCVLPVVDAPPPMVVEPAPMAPIPVSGGFGITPILLGLAGIAIIAALIFSQDNDNDDSPPLSVN